MANLIKKIEMDNFRGASRPSVIEFDPTKNMAVIFGENGRGKSTIVDAIDMVANGLPGSLAGRPSTSTKQHLPSIASDHQDLSVKLYIDRMEWESSLDGSTIHVSGDSPCPAVHILRRNQLLKLIETQPAQRYEALRRFVDVDGVEQSEQYLRDCVRETDAELESLSEQLTDAQNELEKLWKAEKSPGESCLKWAQEKSQVDISDIEILADYLKSLIECINTAISGKQRFDLSQNDYKVKSSNLSVIAKEIKNAPGLGATEAIQLLNILQQTQAYFLKLEEPPTKCPVCEQVVIADQLTDSIQRRLADMAEFEKLDGRKKSAEREVQGSKTTLLRDLDQLIEYSLKVVEIISILVFLNSKSIPINILG